MTKLGVAVSVIGIVAGCAFFFQQMRTRQAEKARSDIARANEQLVDTLTQLEIQRAEELFTSDNSNAALAYLARILRQHPTNRVAAERLIAALSQRTFALPVLPPIRHEGAVNYAEFSPDGERIVTASDDMTARIWDVHTGQPLTPPLRHQGRVWVARFSPDGQSVITASTDNTVQIWNASTGLAAAVPLHHHHEFGWLDLWPNFSSDGKWVITRSDNQTARVWDARSGQPITESLRHSNNIHMAQFSPDGLRIITASGDTTGQIWDVLTSQKLCAPLKHDMPVVCGEFSPDGKRVVTSTLEGAVRIWDAQTGRPLTPSFQHSNRSVTLARFSRQRQLFFPIDDNYNSPWMWDGCYGVLSHFPIYFVVFSTVAQAALDLDSAAGF